MSEGMTGPHWDFALRLYGRDGVSPACIVLQDRCGVDVNVLLVALYAAIVAGRRVGSAEIAALDMAGAGIRDMVVVPLRAIRRQMKGADFGPATEQARNKVKAAELSAEQLEQAALAALVAQWPAGKVTPEAVIGAVVAHYGRPDAEAEAAMVQIAAAAEAMAA